MAFKRLRQQPKGRAIRSIGKVRIEQQEGNAPEESGGGGGEGGAQEQEKSQEQEQPPQEQQEQSSQEQETVKAEGENEYYPEIIFPLVSSHKSNGLLHTIAICITSDGCTLQKCSTPQFGAETIRKHQIILTRKGLEEKHIAKVGEVIERARQGDQNAMAIIALVRRNSKKGNPRARTSFRLFKKYIDLHPVAKFGNEVAYNAKKQNIQNLQSSVMFANGPNLSNQRIQKLYYTINPRDRRAFVSGLKSSRNALRGNQQFQLYNIGQILDKARRIQNVRLPNSNITKFCPNIGWELGE